MYVQLRNNLLLRLRKAPLVLQDNNHSNNMPLLQLPLRLDMEALSLCLLLVVVSI